MTMTEPQTLDSVEAVEEAITRNVEDDGDLGEYEALLDRRSKLEREQSRGETSKDTAQKNVKDLLQLADEARLRAETAKEARQATAEEKFYLELTARTAEVEAIEQRLRPICGFSAASTVLRSAQKRGTHPRPAVSSSLEVLRSA